MKMSRKNLFLAKSMFLALAELKFLRIAKHISPKFSKSLFIFTDSLIPIGISGMSVVKGHYRTNARQ